MHRNHLIGLLETYKLKYPEESKTILEYKEFVSNNSKCFDRELEIGHVTGSAWLVNKSGDSVLLTHHKKLNIWLQLGGHADGESDVLEVAMKEAVEESGIKNIKAYSKDVLDVDIHLIPARKQDPAHFHYDIRFVFQALDDDYIVSDESHDLSWVPLEKLEDYTIEELMLRMRKKWLSLYLK